MARRFNEKDHPRDPGGEDGGQFIRRGTSAAGGDWASKVDAKVAAKVGGREAPARPPAKKAAPPKKMSKDDRVRAVATALHEDWRKTRKQKDGSYEPRMKDTKDARWIKAHGSSQVDIANTPYHELPSDWQAENKAAAEVVESIILRRAGKVDLSNPRVRQVVGDEIHQEWLQRNKWAAGGELDVPFDKLPKAEQDKDLDQMARALEVLQPKAPAKKAAPAGKSKPLTPAQKKLLLEADGKDIIEVNPNSLPVKALVERGYLKLNPRNPKQAEITGEGGLRAEVERNKPQRGKRKVSPEVQQWAADMLAGQPQEGKHRSTTQDDDWAAKLEAKMTGSGEQADLETHAAGSWRKPSVQQLQDELRGQLEQELQLSLDRWTQEYGEAPSAREMQFALDQIESRVRKIAEGQSTQTVYRNGPHSIVVDSDIATEVDLDRILPVMDDLIKRFPPARGGGAKISIRSAAAAKKRDTRKGDTGGKMTGLSTGIDGEVTIMLSEDVFGPAPARAGGWHMPAASSTDRAAYTLMHEWGHALESPDAHYPGDGHQHDLGRYGQTNEHEGFAEAFAEWYATGGKTKNKAAQDLAKQNGWSM